MDGWEGEDCATECFVVVTLRWLARLALARIALPAHRKRKEKTITPQIHSITSHGRAEEAGTYSGQTTLACRKKEVIVTNRDGQETMAIPASH